MNSPEPYSIWLRKGLGEEADSPFWDFLFFFFFFCLLCPETAGGGNTGSGGKGCLLELVSWSKSLKLAFSKSQQYKALFFSSHLNKLVHTLKFTFLCAVDQRRRQYLLRLVSKSVVIISVESRSSLQWMQTPESLQIVRREQVL